MILIANLQTEAVWLLRWSDQCSIISDKSTDARFHARVSNVNRSRGGGRGTGGTCLIFYKVNERDCRLGEMTARVCLWQTYHHLKTGLISLLAHQANVETFSFRVLQSLGLLRALNGQGAPAVSPSGWEPPTGCKCIAVRGMRGGGVDGFQGAKSDVVGTAWTLYCVTEVVKPSKPSNLGLRDEETNGWGKKPFEMLDRQWLWNWGLPVER